MGGRAWNDSENEYLKNNFQNESCKIIAKKFGRTTRAVQHQYEKLNLIRKSKYKIGDKFYRLTLIEFIKRKTKHKNIKTFGKFICDCGSSKIVIADLFAVKNGNTKSCGCLNIESARKRAIERNYKHGMGTTREHASWRNMLERCYNPTHSHYKAYGGRGIKVCDGWKNSFENFYKDMGDIPNNKTSIDKLDDYKNYSKENCRWASKEDQLESKDNNKWIKCWDEWKTILHWTRDKRCKADIEIIKYRLWKLGWSTEKSIETVQYEG